MKRRRILFAILLVTGVVVGVRFALRPTGPSRDLDAYVEQVALARKEGLLTNWSEFAKTVPSPPPGQNAAPLYRRMRIFLQRLKGPKADPLAARITFQPSPEAVHQGRQMLSQYQPVIDLGDEAVKLSGCNFGRDWSHALLFINWEVLDMKNLARLYALRGSLAAHSGDSKSAIADARRIFRVAGHIRQEPTLIMHLVGDATYLRGLLSLANWAYTHPGQPEYLAEFQRALGEMPPVDLRSDYAAELFEILDLFDEAQTEQGRKELGLRDTRISFKERALAKLVSTDKAKAQIIRAERDLWAALAPGAKDQDARIERARRDLYTAFAAYPVAGEMFEMLIETSPSGRRDSWLRNRARYTALGRALKGGRIQKSIDTSDLIDPATSKPIGYRYDGHRIYISAKDHKDLAIPPLPPSPPPPQAAAP